MTTVLIAAALLLLSLIGAAFVKPPPARPLVIIFPPRTWGDFLRSPVPWTAPDVALRRVDGKQDMATVYNRAAALQHMRNVQR